MVIQKIKVTCKICKKEVLKTSFNKHLKSHNNPLSRNCNKWYKNFFKKDAGLCVCKICDTEVALSHVYEYETHLKEHGITKEESGAE